MGFINSIIGQGLVDQDYVDQHTYGFEELKARAAEFTPDYVEKITGVKAADVTKFAHEFATIQPSVIRIGVALERHAGGGQAIRAVCALPALVGSWRHVGGGLSADAAVGLPGRLDEGLARRLDQARHARDQQSEAWERR